MPRLFVYHPRAVGTFDYRPFCEALTLHLTGGGEWDGWQLKWWEYDRGSSFSVRDLRSRFGLEPGVVIFVEPVDRNAVAEFRRRTPTAPVLVVGATSHDELFSAAVRGRQLHERGEPLLPRKVVAASLLVRWLLSNNYWGSGQGSHSMAYPNLLAGALPQRLRDMTFQVANDLKQADLLVTKEKGKILKWGLNAKKDVRHAILALARTGEVVISHLRQVMERDSRQESAHLLLEAEKVNHVKVRAAGQAWAKCATAKAAAATLNADPAVGPYYCEVVFDGDLSLVEEAVEKRHLCEFLNLYMT